MKNALSLALLLLISSVLSLAEARSPVPEAGKIVVEEFFNYICPACNKFEPQFSAWAEKLPTYVRVDHVPVAFRKDFVPYAHAYYAAQFFDLADKTHQAAYDAIHRTHQLPAEGDQPDEQRVAEFYAGYGVDAKKFLDTMQGFSIKSQVRRATKHMQRSKVRSTPSILINGRYLVRGTSFPDKLRIASYLIEKEHTGE